MTGYAQSRQVKAKKPGFFERLFGPRSTTPPAGIKKSSRTKKRVRHQATEPAVEAAETVPKDPKARKILVIGDFVADGIAWGLEQSFASEPKLVVVDRSNAGSGFVRADHFDWNKQLTEILNQEKPDLIIAAFGINDRQTIRDGNERLAVRSEGWEAAYTQRIEGIVETLKVYGQPFFWVGAPPVRTTSASADLAYFNGLYRPKVEAAGGHFIDIWIGFTNADGQYITTGPDIEGQVRALRTGDGINFTRAGRLKLAFYVERDVRRQTGIGAGAIDLLASTTQSQEIEIGPDGRKRLVGPVISLSDPLPGASDSLAGAPAPVMFSPLTGVVTKPAVEEPIKPTDKTETAQYRLVVKGEPLIGVGGRIDDFSWPPEQRATEPPAPPVPVLPTADAGLAASPPVSDAEPTAEGGEANAKPVSKSN